MIWAIRKKVWYAAMFVEERTRSWMPKRVNRALSKFIIREYGRWLRHTVAKFGKSETEHP